MLQQEHQANQFANNVVPASSSNQEVEEEGQVKSPDGEPSSNDMLTIDASDDDTLSQLETIEVNLDDGL